MAVEEQHRAEAGVRRRIELLTAVRVFFAVLAPGAAVLFAMGLATGKTAGAVWAGVSVVCAVILCAYWTAAIRRLKRPVAVGQRGRRRTLSAWSATGTVDHNGMLGPVTFEDITEGLRLGGTRGLIRVAPAGSYPPLSGKETVVARWTVETCAATPVEAYQRLREAEPLLFDKLYRDEREGVRRCLLVDGVLVDVHAGTPAACMPCRAELVSPAVRVQPVEPAAARPGTGAVRLDPRWEWKLVQRLGMSDEYVKVRCLHAEIEPVESALGEVVAQLCLTCDTQFPAPREP